MSSHDGIIELNREITRLESALAAERADCARAKESLDERCKTIIEQRTRIDFLDPYCKRLEEELAAEREKVVALEAENEGLLKLDVRTLNAVVGRLEATVGSPAAVRILAMSFAAFLRENKGENFCTVDCVDSSDPENPVAMSVTVARKGGKSTAEVLAELRAERDALSDRVRGLEGDTILLTNAVQAWTTSEGPHSQACGEGGDSRCSACVAFETRESITEEAKAAIQRAIDREAAIIEAALTPPAPQQECALCRGVGRVNRCDGDTSVPVDCPKCVTPPAPAKAAREGEAQA